MLVKKIKSFSRINNKEKLFLLEVLLLIHILQLVIIFVKFKYISRFLGQQKRETDFNISKEQCITAKRVSKVIKKVSRNLYWKPKCLVQALTAKLILNSKGIESTLYIGVKRDDEKKLLAHAWTRCGNIFLTGGENKNQFVTLNFFG